MGSLADVVKRAEGSEVKKRERPTTQALADRSVKARHPQDPATQGLAVQHQLHAWLPANTDRSVEPNTLRSAQDVANERVTDAECYDDSNANIQLSGKTFYASHRLRNLNAGLLRLLSNAKNKFGEGVLAAPFEHFALQEQAFAFADSHQLAHELSFFSLEMDETGRRTFIVTSNDEFYRQYREMAPGSRHYYEIIREGRPCHLYFDLEYKTCFNSQTNGEQLVDLVICLATELLQAWFDLELQRSWIQELDSTTDSKFSRHLIIALPGCAFQSNFHVKAFVEGMCSKIWAPKEQYGSLQIVKDIEGNKGDFIDTGVYTKNRAFRLMLSSKFGKDSFLTPTGRFRPTLSTSKTFYESLICNISPEARLLQCFDGNFHSPLPSGSSSSPGAKLQKIQAAPTKTGPSPFPQVERFIQSRCNQGGIQGRIRSWSYKPLDCSLLLNVSHYRFCDNIQRHHRSNGIYFIVNLRGGYYHQKCYDPDCRDYRSTAQPLPADVFREVVEKLEADATAKTV